jgi:hypothetical protein
MIHERKNMVVTVTPMMEPDHLSANTDGYNGSALGNLLIGMMGSNKELILQSRDWILYVKGLRDAGMLGSGRLYEMMQKCGSIRITALEGKL